MRKIISGITLILLVIAVSFSSKLAVSNTIQPTQSAVLRFIPQPLTVKAGETFTIACVIEDVTDLYGLDIQIVWDTYYIDYVSHTATIPVENYPNPIPPSPYAGTLHQPLITVKDEANTTAGTYWVAAASLPPAPVFDGNGTIFLITLKALVPTPTVTWINFTDPALPDTFGAPIPHTAENAQIRIEADTSPPNIIEVEWKGTSPYPYAPSNFTRAAEPVLVTANITDAIGVNISFLSYRVDGRPWWNTTMYYNGSNGLWETIIPGQPGNTTVQFFITAYDNNENMNATSIFEYDVQLLLVGDLDADGDVDIYDIVMICGHYGETYP